MTPISVSVPDGQGGVCWVARSGNRLYATNNTTDNISIYSINSVGQLNLQNAIAAAVGPGNTAVPLLDRAFPLDNAIGNQGKTFYELTDGPSTAPGAQIHAFSIDQTTGNLTDIGTTIVGASLAGEMGMAALDF